MALSARLDTLDGLDDAEKRHYEERNGKFYLKVTPVDGLALEDVAGLKTTVGTVRKERDDLKDLLKAWDALGLAPDEVVEQLETAKRLSEIDPEKEAPKLARELLEQWQKSELKKVQTAHQKELEKAQAQAGALKGQVEELLVDSKVLSAIVNAGGRPKALSPLVRSYVRIVPDAKGRLQTEIIDPVTQAPRTGPSGTMTLDELVAELAEDPELAGNFDGKVKPGGGTPPGGGGSAAPGAGKPRSQMSAAEKAKYIRDFGREAFHNLPL